MISSYKKCIIYDNYQSIESKVLASADNAQTIENSSFAAFNEQSLPEIDKATPMADKKIPDMQVIHPENILDKP